MMEVVTVGGIPHMKVFQEAVLAQYNRFLGIKRYDKLDYEKWMGGYDVSAAY